MNLFNYTVFGQPATCFAAYWVDVLALIHQREGQQGVNATIYLDHRPATDAELAAYELQQLRSNVEAQTKTIHNLRASLALANRAADKYTEQRDEQIRLRRVEMTAYQGSVSRLKAERDRARAYAKSTRRRLDAIRKVLA